MDFSIYLVCFCLLAFLFTGSEGLKCYTCSCTEDDSDTSCADDVESMGTSGITDCDKKYCTITRVDYKDPKGKLASINRNCVDKVQSEGVTEDESYRTYIRSCKTDLCNNGSGKGSSSTSRSSLGDKSTIYVPGTQVTGGTNTIQASLLTTLIIHFILKIIQ
ncbi:uncharacterized protein LOC143198834 [Rhynchophorus ferrugineus]|uniref:Protein sleepless n=1 Tax=Rhynchophorus ferrugineus TaxID=354439 RepID=A0A834HY52_RHYFE|nr:hypothetical protein GWI33_019549 [Rhynchophorus ferrugineus]